MNVNFHMLGHMSSYHSKTNTICRQLSSTSNQYSLRFDVAIDTIAFHPLSTFHTTVHLIGPDTNEKGCLQANITPEISSALREALRYVPISILFFVLFVGIALYVCDSSQQAESSLQAVLPGFADCLQYLQFIFLTGSLSLFYPGFYQPAVGRLGWTSLFADGLIPHEFTYTSINDGIYEVNGTYGGTFGLELMTQIVGAPTTMGTWLNMVILIVAIAALSAICIEIFWLLNRPVGSDTGLRRAFKRTLHVVLSYFMLPLIALSCYQLDNASHLPFWNIFLASVFILSIFSAFAWLFLQIPTRSLGILIFNGRKQYHQISSSDVLTQQHKSFVIILFVLVFIRGVTIGGLQISGRAQLAVLGACELVLLVCAIQFQAYSLLSIEMVSAVARLVVLLCMVAFVPGVASDNARSAIGYLILLTHASVIQFGQLCCQQPSDSAPLVYGLRQLRRREVLRTSLPDRPGLSLSSDNDTYRDSTVYHESMHYSDGGSRSHHDSNSGSGRGYYRPPRHSRFSPQHSINLFQEHNLSQNTHSDDQYANLNSTGRLRTSYEASSSSSSGTGTLSTEAPTNTDTKSLHPRWGDYSFRESDLYYGTPRPVPAGGTTIEAPRATDSRHSMRPFSLSGLWAGTSRESNTTERGFSVARPPRPP
ncbi:hypothetical protein F5Y00DRAFT_273429 [Daldinia vernicosa]|uniref:uncharacterized protein n=1 Tax=Daldinia vernicosa TaxID=114800 RepID=UPI0020073DBA|nr:uncharacterized protein F5Y00DRAFT_273429 [Daldinia vernicosa]KAI0844948.1 hypothetical protein F5Y00DRAFT_273429 [Daldinia vernicosa]